MAKLGGSIGRPAMRGGRLGATKRVASRGATRVGGGAVRPRAAGATLSAGAGRVAPFVVPPEQLRPADDGSRKAAAMTAEEVVAELRRREGLDLGNTYAMAVCLHELSKVERYRNELKYESFESLLEDLGLGSRVTAFKHIVVEQTFSQADVEYVGGMEKSYLLIRWSRRSKPKANPRDLLAPGLVVLGKRVPELSVRDLRNALRELEGEPAMAGASAEATKKSARQLRGWLERAKIRVAVRAHMHEGKAYVSARFSAASATQLSEIVKAARKAGLA
jgi:hypothetical protein